MRLGQNWAPSDESHVVWNTVGIWSKSKQTHSMIGLHEVGIKFEFYKLSLNLKKKTNLNPYFISIVHSELMSESVFACFVSPVPVTSWSLYSKETAHFVQYTLPLPKICVFSDSECKRKATVKVQKSLSLEQKNHVSEWAESIVVLQFRQNAALLVLF